MTDRYINAAELHGVLDGVVLPCAAVIGDTVEEAIWDEDEARHEDWGATCHIDDPRHIRLDTHRPEVQHHLCLTWGPRVDGRWKIVNSCDHKNRAHFEFRSGPMSARMSVPGVLTPSCAATAMEESKRAHWLSLLNNPTALAAECRAVMEDKTNA